MTLPPVAAADLPFTLAHGAWIWTIPLVLVVAFAIAAQVAVRRRRARHAARCAAAAWAGRATALREGEVIVRATVRGGAASTLWGAQARHHHRDAMLRFDAGGEAMIPVADVIVVHGASSRTRRSGTPRGTPDAMRGSSAKLVRGPTVLLTVRDGDEVIVSGTASRAPAPGGAGYHDGAPMWTIGGDRVEVVAVRPAGGALALSLVRLVATILLTAGVGYYALVTIGDHALGRMEASRRGPRPAVDELNAYTVAAMMPGSRTRALDALKWVYRDARTDGELAIAAGLARLAGGCAAEAQVFEDHHRFDLALARAEACDEPRQIVDAALRLGMHDRAAIAAGRARVPFSAQIDGVAYIGAGRWADAARSAERQAEEEEKWAREGAVQLRDGSMERAAGLRCLAAQFRAWAGDAAARQELIGPADGGNGYCAVLRAATEPTDRRLDALRALRDQAAPARYWHHSHRDRLAALVDVLIWADGGTTEPAEFEMAIPWGLDDAILDDSPPVHLWYAPMAARAFAAAIESGSSDPATAKAARDAVLWTAVLDAYRGRLDAALAATARAEALAPPGSAGDYTRETIRRVHEKLRLHTPATDLRVTDDSATAERDARLRAGALPFDADMAMGVYPDSCEDEQVAAVTSAVGGDGRPLVRVFLHCTVYWTSMKETVIDVLPRVVDGKAELARALRYFRSTVDDTLWYFLGAAFLHRTQLRLAGDDAGADYWQGIIDRHLAVLADRDKLLALTLWTL
jgi:hypothetical protein